MISLLHFKLYITTYKHISLLKVSCKEAHITEIKYFFSLFYFLPGFEIGKGGRKFLEVEIQRRSGNRIGYWLQVGVELVSMSAFFSVQI